MKRADIQTDKSLLTCFHFILSPRIQRIFFNRDVCCTSSVPSYKHVDIQRVNEIKISGVVISQVPLLPLRQLSLGKQRDADRWGTMCGRSDGQMDKDGKGSVGILYQIQ